jgi:two-component system, NarL family, response regulator DesR
MRTTLSTDERAVLRLAAAGLSSGEAAGRLGMSAHDVRRQLVQIIEALSARSKLDAILIALRHGLIHLADD